MVNAVAPYGVLLNEGYKPRLIEPLITEGLEDFGAVCIEGAKYCGKTWTAQAFSNSEVNLMSPAGNFQNLELALLDPETVLLGSSQDLLTSGRKRHFFGMEYAMPLIALVNKTHLFLRARLYPEKRVMLQAR